MTDEVMVDGDTVGLLSRGKLLDAQRRDALERVYAVSAGSVIVATDVEFDVFRFHDRFWVLPWKTAPIGAAVAAIWPDGRQMAERCWDAVLDELPRRWRKSYLGGLVHAHWPALLVLPVSTLPPWRIKRQRSNGGFFSEHEYPYLDALIGRWFHEDWDIEGPALEAVIASFRKSMASADLVETRVDIERLLNRYDDQSLAGEIIRIFRPGVDPEGWGMSPRQWLERIAELLRP